MAFDLKNFLGKMSFGSARAEFYEDVSEAIQGKESIIDFLRNEARRELRSGSKLRAALYSKWTKRFGDKRVDGKIAGAMKGDIPQNDLMIISAFEEAGSLREGFDVAKESAQRTAELIGIYKSAAIYPVIAIIAVISVASFLVGAFPKVGDEKAWPAVARASYHYMQFLSGNSVSIIVGMIVASVLIGSDRSPIGLTRLSGSFREKVLDKYVPPWTMYKEAQSATVLVLLAALIRSGLSTSASIKTIADGSGGWMRGYLSGILRRIGDKNNEQVVYAFKNSIFSDRLYFRLEASALRGGFDRALIRMATTSFKKIIDRAHAQAFAMQQIFIAFAGGSMLLMVMGMISMGFALAKL